MDNRQQKHAVFFDPKRKRWSRTKWLVNLASLAALGIFGFFVFTIISSPDLPPLTLSKQQRYYKGPHPDAPPNLVKTSRRNPRTVQSRWSSRSVSHDRVNAQATLGHPPVAAFYVDWDDTSFTSLKQNVEHLDALMPGWLYLGSESGSLSSKVEPKVLKLIAEKKPAIELYPLLNNYGADNRWEGDKLARFLNNAAARNRLIRDLTVYLLSHHFAGVTVDFEEVPDPSQPALRSFMAELAGDLRLFGLKVSQCLPAQDESYDYRYFGAVTDFVVLMDYDQHWSSSEPGPIAAQGWFADILARRAQEIPPEKLVLAVANYGYDWEEGKPEAGEITFQEAIVIARESDGKISFDPDSLNPTFDYWDDNDRRHRVWFLGAVSTFDEMRAAEGYPLRGLALWRLGSEDPSIWDVLTSSARDAESAAKLQTLSYGYGVDYNGRGEILRVDSTPQDGKRTLKYDPALGLITEDQYAVFPSPYAVARYGRAKHQVALTFDDGPDRRFTPAILDILKKEGAPATFFVTGANGGENVDLLRRMIAEGHEIGNHTFTHPDIGDISVKQLEMELNSTQRLFESKLGRQSIYFRPPYGTDAEPETPAEVKPLEVAERLGYIVVGERIDPHDWQTPGRDEIVKAVIDQAGTGNIILLHDGGGDRSETIAALPDIIHELRNRGYVFVPVSALLGKTRDQVMPPLPPDQYWQARIDDLIFTSYDLLAKGIRALFLIGIILGTGRILFIAVLATGQWSRSRSAEPPAPTVPTVTVIVPAFNEERVIAGTVQSLLDSNYSNLDILVINDGSADRTVEVLAATFPNEPKLKIFSVAAGGKAHALSFGFQQTESEIVVTLDADTIFEPDTISKLVAHFVDPQVGAVAGNAKVGNRINVLTKWQALEYITSQNLDRRAFDTLNCITVVPGAVGAWRRDVVLAAGGFKEDTLAEDADLTMSIRRLGYRIIYEDLAVAWTEAPDTVRNFLTQRFRWSFGTMQAVWKHRDTFGRRRFGSLGLVALPNILIFQLIFPFLSPLIDLLMLSSIVMAVFQKVQHPAGAAFDSVLRILIFYAMFLLFDYGSCILAFALEKRAEWSLLFWVFWQRFFYRQLMYYVAIKSLATAVKGAAVGWGKVERKATIQPLHAGIV